MQGKFYLVVNMKDEKQKLFNVVFILDSEIAEMKKSKDFSFIEISFNQQTPSDPQ
ncbi:MAG: hypothetical protein IPM51_12155 [Sphingobacteriaceae bacterium]|nr:hypothetical protein [Sphingobacteriaceae bacterium]